MLRFPCFLQQCPVCGRPLEVRRDYVGTRVACRHCNGRFVASDPDDRENSATIGGDRLIRRAEQLLALSALWLRCHRGPARSRWHAKRDSFSG